MCGQGQYSRLEIIEVVVIKDTLAWKGLIDPDPEADRHLHSMRERLAVSATSTWCLLWQEKEEDEASPRREI